MSTDIEPNIHLVLQILSSLEEVTNLEEGVAEEAARVLNTYCFCKEFAS